MSDVKYEIQLNVETRQARVLVRTELAIHPQVFVLPFAFVKLMASQILAAEGQMELQPRPAIVRPT